MSCTGDANININFSINSSLPLSPAPAEKTEVRPAGAAHLTAKRYFSDSTTELQQMLCGNCSPWGRVEELSGPSFRLISPLSSRLKTLLPLLFPPDLTHKLGSFWLLTGPILQLCQSGLICQSVSMAQGALPWARVRKWPPFRVFRRAVRAGSLQGPFPGTWESPPAPVPLGQPTQG